MVSHFDVHFVTRELQLVENAALKCRKIHLAEDLLHRVVDGGDLLDGSVAGQFVPYVATDGPNRAGPLVLQEGLQ